MRARRAGAAAGAFLLLMSPPPGSAASDPAPFGLWARGDGKARVRIARCGSDICAVNVWIRPGTEGEEAGHTLVMSVAPAGGGRWTGTAFDPQRALHYHLTMTVGDTSMTTRGCIVAGLLCKDMGWTRLSGE